MYQISDRIISWANPETIEPAALQQLYNIASLPIIYKHVAVMPDVHLGRGATVGSVIATRGGIIPAAVGVDIGCGMIAVRTPVSRRDLPPSLKDLRLGIERRIPLGAGAYNRKLTESAQARVRTLEERAETDYHQFDHKWKSQMGSLGAGNHFIEITLDEEDRVWAFLHSGSRGIGNKIAMHHIRRAQALAGEQGLDLPDRDLAYFVEGMPEFGQYMRDLLWAQEFARLNREEMMDRVLTELSYALFGEDGHQSELEGERVNCHHNFSQRETHFGEEVWVTRKGAIEAREGQPGLIPGSMGTASYVVTGLGNDLSYNSSPHGAGRRFSRGEARRRFTMEDFDACMLDVECRRSAKLLDELPGAYKDIDEVMAESSELVRVEHKLRQIVNVKGD